jgi:outer membrane protein
VKTLIATAICLVSATAAKAEDFPSQVGELSLHAGVAGLLFNSSGKFDVAGQRLPGAGLKTSNNVTVVGEVGYYVTPNISLTLTVGVPPVTKANGTGVLTPLGRLGSARYGPTVLFANYHFTHFGRFQPWVAAGPTALLVFGTKDGALQHLKVDDQFGAGVEVGAEYRVSHRVGFYGSVAHLFLHTDGHGTFAGAPILAKVDLNPTVVQGGVAFHF